MEWYIGELSKLTGASKRTLHHYDAIGLLEPSLRISNGYRLYSEDDLLRLERIIALKTFGFELNEIKNLLDSNSDILPSLQEQLKLLEVKGKKLNEVKNILKEVIESYSIDKNLQWNNILNKIKKLNYTDL